MNTNTNHLMALVGTGILLLAGAGAPIVSGQSGKVVSSYFNLIQQLHLTAPEKQDLVAFLRAL